MDKLRHTLQKEDPELFFWEGQGLFPIYCWDEFWGDVDR